MRIFLSLGSNVGDRAVNLEKAIAALDASQRVQVVGVSPIYETEPVGVQNQPDFLNAAMEVETDLDPLELLSLLKNTERQLGRPRDAERWGPRTIDVDIILWGQEIVQYEQLTIPHREFRDRAFVLMPLRDLAPDALDPVTGKTVAELAAACHSRESVRPYYDDNH